jgi:hypothetical protein
MCAKKLLFLSIFFFLSQFVSAQETKPFIIWDWEVDMNQCPKVFKTKQLI